MLNMHNEATIVLYVTVTGNLLKTWQNGKVELHMQKCERRWDVMASVNKTPLCSVFQLHKQESHIDIIAPWVCVWCCYWSLLNLHFVHSNNNNNHSPTKLPQRLCRNDLDSLASYPFLCENCQVEKHLDHIKYLQSVTPDVLQIGLGCTLGASHPRGTYVGTGSNSWSLLHPLPPLPTSSTVYGIKVQLLHQYQREKALKKFPRHVVWLTGTGTTTILCHCSPADAPTCSSWSALLSSLMAAIKLHKREELQEQNYHLLGNNRMHQFWSCFRGHTGGGAERSPTCGKLNKSCFIQKTFHFLHKQLPIPDDKTLTKTILTRDWNFKISLPPPIILSHSSFNSPSLLRMHSADLCLAIGPGNESAGLLFV